MDNEDRIGVSLDSYAFAAAQGKHWHVTLDGLDVVTDVREAQGGVKGWVVLFERDAAGQKFERDDRPALKIEIGVVVIWLCAEEHPTVLQA